MLPFLEVSYVPSWLSSDNCTKRVMSYAGCCAPPADYGRWSALLTELGQALIGRYGLAQARAFRFEIWNELDCLNVSEYHSIYAAAARGLKRASPALQVGGPATSCADGWDEPPHPQQGRLFLEFVRDHSVPLDFFSSHIYANKKWTGWAGRASTIVQGVRNATALMDEFGLAHLPYYNTEFGSLSGQGSGVEDKPADDIHDTHEQASFLVAAVDQLAARARRDAAFRLPTTLSYWTFSDIMNEVNADSALRRTSLAPGWTANTSFHGGFGLINAFGVPKPSFRVYELLHEAHGMQLPVARTAASSYCNLTTGLIATAGNGSAQLLLYNHREWDAPQLGHPNPSAVCDVHVALEGAGLPASATVRVIDQEHTNPRGKWIELGMPAYPSPAEHAQIMAASEMVPRTVAMAGGPARRELTLTLARHSVVAVSFEAELTAAVP
jgi:xylan 1,4-beta-xylosidase